MTVCVAMLCDEAKALVLVADKMIGIGYIETEPEIKKLLRLHKDWWVMFAGEDITPVLDVVDRAKRMLDSRQSVSLDDVVMAMQTSWEKQRADEADDLCLTPRGWTREKFRTEGRQLLPETLYAELDTIISRHELEIELVVAGFDNQKLGHIFAMDGKVKRGIPQRCDVIGFCAIGSGGVGATYMMYYRKCSPGMKIREALYYAIEGKYFGEYAGGVGLKTDACILRPGEEPIEMKDEETIEKKFMETLCEQLSPRELKRLKHLEMLNTLPELEGKGIAKLEAPVKGKRKVVINP